jgi:hypothetical protein
LTRARPPRLAVALLRRFLSDNEALAGDLLERYEVRQSRLWFGREVLAAIAIRALQHRDRDRPLTPHVSLTASPLPGVGGLGLVALSALVTLVRPGAWWIFLPALAGGVALGLTLVLLRRRGILQGSGGTSRTLLRD